MLIQIIVCNRHSQHTQTMDIYIECAKRKMLTQIVNSLTWRNKLLAADVMENMR